jgi:hypothetical protein
MGMFDNAFQLDWLAMMTACLLPKRRLDGSNTVTHSCQDPAERSLRKFVGVAIGRHYSS